MACFHISWRNHCHIQVSMRVKSFMYLENPNENIKVCLILFSSLPLIIFHQERACLFCCFFQFFFLGSIWTTLLHIEWLPGSRSSISCVQNSTGSPSAALEQSNFQSNSVFFLELAAILIKWAGFFLMEFTWKEKKKKKLWGFICKRGILWAMSSNIISILVLTPGVA